MIKMFTKEDITPANADRVVYNLAPALVMISWTASMMRSMRPALRLRKALSPAAVCRRTVNAGWPAGPGSFCRYVCSHGCSGACSWSNCLQRINVMNWRSMALCRL